MTTKIYKYLLMHKILRMKIFICYFLWEQFYPQNYCLKHGLFSFSKVLGLKLYLFVVMEQLVNLDWKNYTTF